jgi:hypothetical protein
MAMMGKNRIMIYGPKTDRILAQAHFRREAWAVFS